MQITPAEYKQMQARHAPASNSLVNVPVAFLTGGGICVLGQLLLEAYQRFIPDRTIAAGWVSVTLVLLSALLTGLGLYGRIARHAGAGTLVPITGFANAIASSAMEARTEGFILGVGTKIFTIAGPVILYGCTAASVCGLVYWIAGML